LWHVDRPELNAVGTAADFPIVCTTYRVSEHWQAGAMTRNIPWLCELMPDVFVEIGPALARQKGIKSGDRVVVRSARGQMEAYALVTKRFQRLQCGDKEIHEVGVVWHYGYTGLATGDSANLLTPHIGDANTMIPEYKAFLCDVMRKEVV
jgi:formate dehydrogenase major subunit